MDILIFSLPYTLGIFIVTLPLYKFRRTKTIIQKILILLLIPLYFADEFKTLVIDPHVKDEVYIKIFYDNEKRLKELVKQMPVDGCKEIYYPIGTNNSYDKIRIKSQYQEICYDIEQPPFQEFIKGKELINLIGGDVDMPTMREMKEVEHYGHGAYIIKQIVYRPYLRVDRENKKLYRKEYRAYFERYKNSNNIKKDNNGKDIMKYREEEYSNRLLNDLNGFLPDGTLKYKSCAYREIEPKWYIEVCKEVFFLGGNS